MVLVSGQCARVAATEFSHSWRVRTHLPDRYGHRCRVLVHGRGPGPRSLPVEFEDGVRVVTTRWNVRRMSFEPAE